MRAALLLCLALCGCASFGAGACPQGLKQARIAELFFGRNVGAEERVSDADWQRFLDGEITPRFPDGFTVSDATGAWRGRDGKVLRERSKLLQVVIAEDSEAKLAAIRAAYKRRFAQESVLLVETRACAGF